VLKRCYDIEARFFAAPWCLQSSETFQPVTRLVEVITKQDIWRSRQITSCWGCSNTLEPSIYSISTIFQLFISASSQNLPLWRVLVWSQSATEFRSQLREPQSVPETKGTFLTLFVTLDPILKPADAPRPKFESEEDEETLKLCSLFVDQCLRRSPTRHVKATVVDLKGEAVLITRCGWRLYKCHVCVSVAFKRCSLRENFSFAFFKLVYQLN